MMRYSVQLRDRIFVEGYGSMDAESFLLKTWVKIFLRM